MTNHCISIKKLIKKQNKLPKVGGGRLMHLEQNSHWFAIVGEKEPGLMVQNSNSYFISQW